MMMRKYAGLIFSKRCIHYYIVRVETLIDRNIIIIWKHAWTVLRLLESLHEVLLIAMLLLFEEVVEALVQDRVHQMVTTAFH